AHVSPKDQYDHHTTDERLFPNCVQLAPNFKVEWEGKGDSLEIRLTAEIDENQYMSFGLSPRQGEPVMENSDVVVAYYDSADGSYHAVDYSITARTPCDGTYGVCPDERIGFRNDASVITGERSDGFTSITYKRPYETGDRHDLPVLNGPQTVVAAIGSLDVMKEAKYHTQFVTKRTPSWGIAWWVNELLIPEIYVVRGQTYYFVVEGGDDPTKQASSFVNNDLVRTVPLVLGRLCQWKPNARDSWKESATFAEYRNTLYKDCADGKPGYLEWTVPKDTPDLVYYQCYTHRNLGWKIHVKNEGVPPSERFSGAQASVSSAAAVVLAFAVSALLR
ncbi:protein Skeletor, isoforms B/C, partial [Hyalella azteca]|uniref:Protein Skeletor, isoforms B/C n=1 Tax=Hyalella azteca TaxID=294128 RepID=A0A8B7P4A3_HYAAZ